MKHFISKSFFLQCSVLNQSNSLESHEIVGKGSICFTGIDLNEIFQR
jgi:hypothetical protein